MSHRDTENTEKNKPVFLGVLGLSVAKER